MNAPDFLLSDAAGWALTGCHASGDPEPRTTPTPSVVVAADQTSVVVAVGSTYVINGQQVTSDKHRCRVVVLEAVTGRQRWAVENLVPWPLSTRWFSRRSEC